MRTVLYGVLAGLLLLAPLAVTSYGTASAQSQVSIDGAGATFPFPLIDTWRVEYQDVRPNVSLNYQSIGSGGGIRQFTEMTVGFGATDAPLTQAQRDALPGVAVHVPETIGSVVATYNLPGVESGLHLTGPIIADIFLGVIDRWDDPAIAELNPDVSLPARDIIVVHRSDGSGTTFVWTSYLSLVSSGWEDEVGSGTAVQWPTGIGAPGNEGVANSVRNTPYSMGYNELAYALTTGMDYASIQNQAGNFVEPSLDSTAAAVEALAGTLPAGDASWENVSLLDAPGEDSYPIASFSYILLYKDMSTNPSINQQEAEEIVRFVSWAVTDGQEFAEPLEYVPLPEAVREHNLEILRSLTYGNTSLSTAVVPEFGVIAALVLGASIVGVVAYSRFRGIGAGQKGPL
ncbi:phosphate ABC transporter substrate-binding protein PstS [Nitrososphaera sp.]|uniref:phosphate ABC transporter substrate-binding protein PstS n=1 Tax=Nitrososphaera sp. TaxID=1971748 RepID=UPI0017D60FA7|nr:phosphate ABC transporter substrate-binding protein PstS [Nitrososphaera sp.]NWG36763.1 phosphate ABC transporter substrate-binding protein PstS [Nitrososphaera sp.]